MSQFAHILAALDSGLLATRHAPSPEPAVADTKHRDLLISMGVPLKHARIIASGSIDETYAAKTVRAWLASTAPLLVLYGAHDGGKTFAAGLALDIITKRWLASSMPRVSAPQMFPAANVHAPWIYFDPSPDGARPREPITRSNKELMLTSALIVVDDFGQEPPGVSHLTINTVEEMGCQRFDLGRRMLITSNLLSPEEILAHMGTRGTRFGERISEYGVCCECPVEGYRGGRGKGTP